MFIHQIPRFVPALFPKLIWSMPVAEESNEVYFTFDDGPTPEITNFVLDCLAQYNAKATFFCIGKNIQVNPDIVNSIIQANHRIGNHTMNHANAWKYTLEQYKNDYQACDEILDEMKIDSVGFRPPYGRVNAEIYWNVSTQYPIYMWSFLSGDYNHDLSTKTIIEAGKKYIKPGSILVFHDSLKAFPRLKVVLPVLLEYCYERNLIAKAL